jgi:hypothetical protein
MTGAGPSPARIPPQAAGPTLATVGIPALKSGAPARGERTAKYNRLPEIAAVTPGLRYGMS